jgi:hypothetical protein
MRARALVRTVVGLVIIGSVAPAACSKSSPAGPSQPSKPALATVEVVKGDDQEGSVGMSLDTLISFRALDQNGAPFAGATLRFTASGGGSLTEASAVTGSDGIATVGWTLDTVPGIDSLAATPEASDTAFVVATATGIADRPDSMTLLDGDAQTEQPGYTLPAPIRVKLVDRYNNPVAGVPVDFSVSGGGSLDTTEVLTDLDGVAADNWTLGPTLGPQTAQALVRDSAVYDIVDLPGSPVAFSATAVGFALDSVTPVPAVVGDTVTLYGTGFGPDPADNAVQIGGRAAPTVDVTQSAIRVEVPAFGCAPAQTRTVRFVSRSDSATTQIMVQPPGLLDLAVGQDTVVEDPDAYCLQIAGSTAPDSAEFLVGLTSTRDWNAVASFTLTASDTSVAEVAPPSTQAVTVPASTDGSALTVPPSSELRLRDWEQSFFTKIPLSATISPSGGGITPLDLAPTATVGDSVSFRVPHIATDPCNDYTTQQATLVYVGSKVVVAVPAVPSLILSSLLGSTVFNNAVNSVASLLRNTSLGLIGQYVGSLADADGRITVLLTPALYGTGAPPVFSTDVDLVSRSTCPASDEGALVYVTTPPISYSLSALTTIVSTLQGVMDASGPGLTHQLTHVAQNVKRIASGIASPMPTWLAEGQAELMVEVVGHALRGDQPGLDYGASVVSADNLATKWYAPRFNRLSYYFGWDGASGQVTGAPELCSLFGFAGQASPCDPLAGPGADWSFMRYLSDQIGPSLSGGEAQLSQSVTLLADDSALDAFLQSTTGHSLATQIVNWAEMLYTDGRVSATDAPALQMQSWNLADIYAAMPAAQRLTPETHGFVSFTHQGSVAGGGTFYLRLASSTGHGALAVQALDPLGSPLSSSLGARFWVVRVR